MPTNKPDYILLIEDNDIDQLIVNKIIHTIDPHKRVELSENGKAAIQFLDNASELPELILLDLAMPHTDGFYFLENLKKINKLIEIPIIVLTSSIHPVDKKKAENLYPVAAYLDKPFSMDYYRDLKNKFKIT
jgi:CheY-like chemotaxis protein